MKKLLFVMLSILGFQSYSLAALLFEPYLGYQVMVLDLKTGSANGSVPFKLDGTGAGVGFRFGYTGTFLFTAFDYSGATLKTSLKEGTGVTLLPGNSLHSSTGVTAGLNLFILRPYVGYIFDDRSVGTSSSLIGTGYKVGVGVTIVPKVQVNAEYYTATFTKYATDSGEVPLPNAATYESGSISGFMINVAVPLSI